MTTSSPNFARMLSVRQGIYPDNRTALDDNYDEIGIDPALALTKSGWDLDMMSIDKLYNERKSWVEVQPPEQIPDLMKNIDDWRESAIKAVKMGPPDK